MRNWIAGLCVLAATALPVGAELVQNGDFSNGVSGWYLGVAKDYGSSGPVCTVAEGALALTRMQAANPGYLNLAQGVDIRKGGQYKLRFEVRGQAAGQYTVSVQHVAKGRHLVMGRPGPQSTEWEVVEADFTGAYDTDSNWLRDAVKKARKSELKNGRIVHEKELGLLLGPAGDKAERSILYFSLGALTGNIEIRNVSIVEVK